MRIPPEILSQISLEYVDAVAQVGGSPYPPWQSLQSQLNPWIWIAHICHHWRHIALRTPRVWARFTAVSPFFIQEMLARSKAVPLSINLICPLYSKQNSLMQVLESFSRIQEIEFQLAPFVYQGLESSFPLEAPLLRRITFRNFKGNYPFLPPILDTCKLPNLTTLTIYHYNIDWTETLFSPSLTHLVVETLEQHDGTLEQLLTALEKMTKLRHLELRFDFGYSPLYPLNDRQIALPYLGHLQLQMSAKPCGYLLSRLEYPPDTLVTLQLYPLVDARRVDELASIVHAKLSRFNFPPILSAAFWVQVGSDRLALNDGTHFAFWTENISADTTIQAGEGILPLLRIHTGPNAVGGKMFTWIGKFAPLAHIKSFIVCGGPAMATEKSTISTSSWRVVLRDMQNVDTLVLNSQGLLRPCMTSIEDDPVPSIPFGGRHNLGKLTHLHIHNTTFRSGLADKLLALLRRRHGANLGLQLLKIGTCQCIDESHIDKFSDFVDEIDWDEHIEFDSPIPEDGWFSGFESPDAYDNDDFNYTGWGEY
ncbi:hypothetical protein NLI96_g4874 [Meripilus lineatus]|uniref:F-box domain-containing protein n=1 Tax=Meripilus lineatus TaxID=2056292 RepID=A0AAD5V437_9APHY|nr:hypothetical protein NLI96_g4874 [Physisporinus lineatus]